MEYYKNIWFSQKTEKRNREDKLQTNRKMIDMNLTPSMTTLNVNGANITPKIGRDYETEWKQKTQLYAIYKRCTL